MTKVSIVIVNYNYCDFVECAIASALNQTWQNIEVVVIDDGSTDDSRARILNFEKRVITIFQENGGHTRAVNAGFSVSHGEFVLFLDADDLLYPKAIASAVSLLRPGDTKIQFQLATIDHRGIDLNLDFPYFNTKISPEQVKEQALTTGWYPWTTSSGNLYSREFLEKIFPLDPIRIPRSPDSIINMLSPLYGPVRTLHQVLGSYRVHGKNTWASTPTNWSPTTAVKWLQLNKNLEVVFVEHARRLGIQVLQPLIHPFPKLEYEMLAHRFAPKDPVNAQSLPATLVEALRWVVKTRYENMTGRLTRLAWLVFLAVVPKEILRRVLPKARGQSSRSNTWKFLLWLIRKSDLNRNLPMNKRPILLEPR